jgi:hypothetical protein
MFVAASAPAGADIYKSVDADGRVLYSNIPSKGAKRMEGLGGSGSARPAASTTSPASFPKIDSGTQKNRDGMRRRILSDELAAEEKLLAEAQSSYRNGSPELLAGEQPASPKYSERIDKLKQSVSLHEKNIIALKQELSALK